MVTQIQALVLNKNQFSKRTANSWIKFHKFKPIKKMHETIHTYRFRLRFPNEDKYEYRMKSITPGVKAVIEIPIQNII